MMSDSEIAAHNPRRADESEEQWIKRLRHLKAAMMTKAKTDEPIFVTISLKHFNALMKLAGQLIDPATAEVDWIYAYTLDPYGLHPDALSPEEQQSGREHFARNPGSNIWVSFDDLPEATRNALRHKEQPSFSFGAGVFNGTSRDIPTKITF